jgi:hypothetical protein
MVITEGTASAAHDTIEAEAPTEDHPRRAPVRKVIATVAAVLAAGTLVGIALAQDRDSDPSDRIPELAPRSRDDVVRDHVERGFIPAATLDDGSRIVGDAVARPSGDDGIRVLVERGVVPAATLSDGTEIASPAVQQGAPTRDPFVRDLVERGLVPAASLSDGTQIESPRLDD